VSPSIIFDRKDFDFREDGTWVPLSGAAWAIRHGWVTTGFKKLNNARISIEDVNYADGTIQDIKDEATRSAEEIMRSSTDVENQAAINDINSNLKFDPFNSPIPFRIQTEKAKRTIDPVLAEKRIRRMLGKHFKVKVIEGAVKVFKQGKAWAVGACKKDSIILSKLAEYGTEYHESFHHVMELLFSPSARHKLHLHYIKRYNNGRSLTEKQTGEYLAEMFMQFINNLPDVHLSWNIRKMFE
jgi:hypothetical protein